MPAQRPQSIDRGVRIAGSIILLVLCIVANSLDPATRILSVCLGLYGLCTGLLNHCPLAAFIIRDKTSNQEKHTVSTVGTISNYAECAFFDGWTQDEISSLVSCAALKEYGEGTDIIVPDVPASCWCIIIAGTVVGSGEKDGVQFSAGACFADEALIQAKARYTVRALTPVQILEVHPESLRRQLAHTPTLGTRLLHTALNTR